MAVYLSKVLFSRITSNFVLRIVAPAVYWKLFIDVIRNGYTYIEILEIKWEIYE